MHTSHWVVLALLCSVSRDNVSCYVHPTPPTLLLCLRTRSPCRQVFFTKGSPQLWKATFSAGKLLNASNAASQDLDPGSRAVVNRAEYFGRRLYVTASGTYEPLVSSDEGVYIASAAMRVYT